MTCGCRLQAPNCMDGEKLFAAFIVAKHAVERGSGGGEKLLSAYRQAEQAYADHVAGRREGDLRVRHEAGTWVLQRRLQGQWSFWFGISKESSLRIWLKTYGFWRYAQIEDGQARDRLTGYYHQRPIPLEPQRRRSAGKTPSLEQLGGDGPAREPVATPRVAPVTAIDLQTQVTLLIAILVARIPRVLTVVDRMSVQRKATEWLVSHGEHMGIHEVKMVERRISEAIRLCDMLQYRGRTRPLQEEES